MRVSYQPGNKCRSRRAIDGPREDDDKGWWHDLVEHIFNDVAPSVMSSIATIFSRLPTNILPKPGFGSFFQKFGKCSKRWRRAFNWRSSQISTGGFA